MSANADVSFVTIPKFERGWTKLQCLALLLLTLLLTAGTAGAASMLSPVGSNLGTVSNCDDCAESVSLTSVFSSGINFGPTNYTTMSVGSNGYVTFGHSNTSFNPAGIAAYTAGPIVAVQYDDLDPAKGGDIYYNQNVAEGYVVVTFQNIRPYSGPPAFGTTTSENTMQIVLRRIGGAGSTDFQIELRYGTIQWASSGNVGGAWPTAGWSRGNTLNYGETSVSGTSGFPNSTTLSNVGDPGVFRWDVVGGVVQSQPTVNQTTAASAITGTSANTGGNVSSDGDDPITERGVVYATTPAPTLSNQKVVVAGTTGSFAASLTGLSNGTTYYVRAYATNSIGTGYGPQIQFTTLSITPPTVSTTAASSVTSSSANSGGNVSSDGGAAVTARGVVYATTPNPTLANTVVNSGSGTGSYASSLSGLAPATTYYVRAFATNSAGTSYGNQVSFTTLAVPPTVSTTAVSAITWNSADSGGTVSADGGSAVTARGVVYATSPSPTLADSVVNSGSGTGSYVSSLSGLLPATTYYVRAFATNAIGTSYGGELNFTTQLAPTTTSIVSTSVGSSAQANQGFDVSVSVSGYSPTGSVTVRARRADNSVVASCVASLSPAGASASGSCSFANGALKPRDGVTHLSAVYSGDGDDATSTSSDFGFSVARGDVSISSVVVDTSGDRNAVSGEPITVTVSLAAVAPALGPVTGDGTMAPDVIVSTSETGTGCTIDWDMTNVCTLVFTGVTNTSQGLRSSDPKVVAAAKASLQKSITVSYSQTADFNSASAAADPVTVSSAPTATLLSTAGAVGGADPSERGDLIRLTATVTALAPSTIAPRGVVQFTRGATVLGTRSLDGSGVAVFDAPARPVGSELYYAFFLSNDDFVGSDDDDAHEVVRARTETLISSVVPAAGPDINALETVTVSASVSAIAPGAGSPSGTITISGTDTSGCVITLPAGSCELSFSSKGSKTLTATYGGDSQFRASSDGGVSDTETVIVLGIPTTISVSGTSPSPSYYGNTYTVSYTLAGGDGSFTGAVTVTASLAGDDYVCTGSTSGASGSCVIGLPSGNAGTYSLSAEYAGDGTDTEATSAAASHVIARATTALVLSAVTPSPVDAAQPVTVALDLSISNGAAPRVGELQVSGPDTTGCSVTLSGGETFPVSCDLSFSVTGSKTLTATFTPTDAANVEPATSNDLVYQVVRAPTTLDITGFAPASGVAQVGDAVTVSFAVSGGVLPYGGAVTVEYGSGPSICTPVSFDSGTGLGSCVIPATALQLAGDYPVSVAYAGDADDVPSDDSASLTVIPRATATTLVSSPADDQQAGQPVTWTISVGAVGGAATTPITGDVFVCPAAAPSCDAGSASCTISLPATSCVLSYDQPQAVSLVARYGGDANYAESTSAADGITIGKRDTSIAITSDLSASTPVGAPVTVAFDVDGGHQTYDGTVTVNATLASPAATASCGPVSVNPTTGVGSCVIEGASGFLRAGSWSLVASYAGDSNDADSTSAAVSHPVGAAGTLTDLVTSPDPSRYGEPFAMTVTVTSSTGAVPTGEVEFFDHTGVSYGTRTLDAAGQASVPGPANLPVGTYAGSTSPFRAFKAVFKANPDFSTSVDPAESHVIGPAAVDLSLVSAGSPSLAGDAVLFTGTASTQAPGQGSPTGTLTITATGPAPASTTVSCTTGALAPAGANASSASCSLSFAAQGSYSVAVTYANADGNFASVSTPTGAITQVVSGNPTSLSIGPSVPANPTYGELISLPFAVSGGRNGNTGTVDLTVDGSPLCSGVSLATGSCSLQPAAAGSYSIGGIYNADGADIDDASSSASLSLSVAKQTPTLTVSAPASANAGDTVTVSASLATTGVVSAPTGSISITVDGAEAGCSIAAPSGSCELVFTATGSPRLITASYVGDANFNGATDSTGITVSVANTAASIDAITPAAPVVGEAIVIDFSLSGGVAPYSGALSLMLDPTPLDTGNGDAFACPGLVFEPATGVGRCTLVNGLANAGDYGVALNYAGDANEGPASDSAGFTVGAASAELSLSGSGSSVVGTSASFAAQVSRIAPARGDAQGLVTITATGPAPSTATQTCTIDPLVAGAGSCGISFSAVGSYSVSASYTSSDANTQSIAGPAGTLSHTVDPAPATIAITGVSPASPLVGQNASISFTVSGGFGGNTGLVNITTVDGASNPGPSCTGLAANASPCVLSFTAAGTYTVNASYNSSGSDVDDSSASTQLSGLVVQRAEGGLVVNLSSASPEVGQSVTINASINEVGGVTATGSITVTRGADPVCVITLPTTSCTISFSTVGTTPLGFAYSGDANYAATSTTAGFNVRPATTSLSLISANPATLLAGESTTVSYSVSGGFGGNTGTVVVTATSGSNTATCSASAAAGQCGLQLAQAGSWSFAATYNASGSDVDDAPSSASAAFTATVSRTPTITVLSLSPATSGPVGTTVTLSAQVDRNAAGSGQPQGAVTFLVDGASIGEVTLSPTGFAQFSTSSLPVGTRVLRAQYNGNADYLVSFDEKAYEVTRKAVSLSITGSSVNPSGIGQAVSFSYSLSTAPGSTPTGNVTLTASTGESCSGSIAAGACSISFTTSGNRSVTASYAGDGLHAPASSAAFAHSVNGTATTIVFGAGNPASITFGQVASISTVVSGGVNGNQGLVTVTASRSGASDVSCTAVASAGSCSLSGLSAGTWSISASYAGDADDAGSNTAAPISLVVNKAPQTISFAALPDRVEGSGSFALSASASSGLAVSFEGLSAPAICTVSGSTATPVGVGVCTIRASQPGNDNYLAATPVERSFNVTSASVDLSIVKTGRYAPGNLVIWTLRVDNLGPGEANGARVIDALPTDVTGGSWTCVGSNGGSCSVASGSGNVDILVNLPNGGRAVFTITATLVNPNAPTVVNTASVQPPAGISDSNMANNNSTLDLQVRLFADGFEGGGTPEVKLAAKAAVQTASVTGALVEATLRGYQPQDVVRYQAAGSELLLQSREIDGLVSVRLLQRDGEGLWTSTRWIELWPGDAAHIDYSSSGGSLKSRLAVGPQEQQ
jgi:hypothetical protein